MKLIIYLSVALAMTLAVSGEQQRILRRVIKSTPTATNLARVRLVTVRSNPESGAVTEISSKEAANFGQRSANETASQQASGTKSKRPTSSSSSDVAPSTTTSTTTPSPTTSTTLPSATTTSTSKPEQVKHKASDRQQAAEVELLSGAPSSWQTMTAVEAPAAMLIATGTRAAASSSSDLSAASSSTQYSSEESSQTGDFLRSSATKGASYTQQQQQAGENFQRVRQQSKQQQSYFYPQENRQSGKTSSFQPTNKWYQPSTTTTQRPAPLVQEQFEQQNEQYVEQQQQQQQIEYNAAPLGQAEPFAFDFKTQDNSGNGQYRKEESDKNGVVRGSYGYTDANGIYRHVDYVADQNGFRANIKSNEPGLIGETQPASIQLAGGAAPANNARAANSRASSSESGEWIASSASNTQGSSADLALAPPEFESSHKSERARLPRHYRN